MCIAIFVDMNDNPKCKECGSVEINVDYMRFFRTLVCNKCKEEHADKYSLLTKTEVKEVT
jgi:DNA-repair protein complementing XP-A cells